MLGKFKYFYVLTLGSSPHVHGKNRTWKLMLDVIIALMPALVWSVIAFGFRALTMTVLSVGACVFFEWGYRKLLKKDCTVGDLSAVVTGILLAFVCPVTLPYWVLVIGDFIAIVLIKQLFGGIGKNFVNPALGARAFMFSWAALMTNWVSYGDWPGIFGTTEAVTSATDAISSATPLDAMHGGALSNTSLLDMFLGKTGGCVGEVSAMLLLVGGLYLMIRRVISLRIPLAYLGTVAVLAFLFPMGNDRLVWTAAQLLSGGLMLGAWFMATDYVTSPVTAWGQIAYGVGCGLVTILIRYFGAYPEGVSYAILIMNCGVVLFDRIGRPRRFGVRKKEGAK